VTDQKKVDSPKAAKPKAKPLVDSEGLRVAHIADETPKEEKSLNAAAKEALDEEDAKNAEWEKFLAER